MHVKCLIKCPIGIFSLIWTLMSTKLWGFSCFLARNMFDFVFYTPFPTYAFLMLCSCIAYSHLLHTPLLHMSCLGLYLVSSSSACHVYFILCCIFKVFCPLFELYFLFSVFILVHIFISFLYSF